MKLHAPDDVNIEVDMDLDVPAEQLWYNLVLEQPRATWYLKVVCKNTDSNMHISLLCDVYMYIRISLITSCLLITCEIQIL